MSVIQDNVAQLEPQSNREQPNIEYNEQGSASSFWDTAQQKQSYLDIYYSTIRAVCIKIYTNTF